MRKPELILFDYGNTLVYEPAFDREAGFRAVLDEGYISNIAVSPALRRQGIGAALLRAMLEEGVRRGLAFLTLEVRVGNAAARRLYRRAGFREAGIRPGYYEKPREDALLMTYYYDQGTDAE